MRRLKLAMPEDRQLAEAVFSEVIKYYTRRLDYHNYVFDKMLAYMYEEAPLSSMTAFAWEAKVNGHFEMVNAEIKEMKARLEKLLAWCKEK